MGQLSSTCTSPTVAALAGARLWDGARHLAWVVARLELVGQARLLGLRDVAVHVAFENAKA